MSSTLGVARARNVLNCVFCTSEKSTSLKLGTVISWKIQMLFNNSGMKIPNLKRLSKQTHSKNSFNLDFFYLTKYQADN